MTSDGGRETKTATAPMIASIDSAIEYLQHLLNNIWPLNTQVIASAFEFIGFNVNKDGRYCRLSG